MIKKLTEILAVIDEEDKFLGYFRDIKAVEKYLEQESVEQATILTVIRVEDAELPPEPMFEFTERKLVDLL